jgi:hypothetical protein
MQNSRPFLLGLAMLVHTAAYGQAKCPWMNEATAGGILGGAVTVTANVTGHGDGVCQFSRQQGTLLRQLRISVSVMSDISKDFPAYLAQCPPTSAHLAAVGNEAVTCSDNSKAELYSEQVVGRVRDQAFAVSVSSSVWNDTSMTQEMRRAKANLAAEQVAGILF